MRRKAKTLAVLTAICLAGALAGCGGGSSDDQGMSPEAEGRRAAPAHPARAVAQGEGKERPPVAGHLHNSGPRKHGQEARKPASRRAPSSKLAPSHHERSSHGSPLNVVEEVVAGDGTGNSKHTVSSPKEMHEVLEEVEHSADPDPGPSGSSSNPVERVLEDIGG